MTIEWTDATWNPIRGCSPVSAGCANCWAARMANRQRSGAYYGFVEDGSWTGKVALVPEQLDKPLHRRKPRKIAVALMGDLLHPNLGCIFGRMAEAPWHTFQVLTKRAKRLRDWSESVMHYPKGDRKRRPVHGWPPNVWLGVSVEDQATANERIPWLLQTPAAVRWVSYEPALGPVDFASCFDCGYVPAADGLRCGQCAEAPAPSTNRARSQIDWVVIGGESGPGPGARPCSVEWLRSAVRQCQQAGVPVFVKQLGRWVVGNPTEFFPNRYLTPGNRVFTPAIIGERREKPPEAWEAFSLWHSRGADPTEWPEDLRVREFPGGSVVP
jgi:protein gp37